MHIEADDLTREPVLALLREHLANMHALSPPESVHALDVSGLRVPEITFWTVWDGEQLLGCGALKELSRTHGEVKSMRTPQALRRRGAGRAVLAHILATACARAALSAATARTRIARSWNFSCETSQPHERCLTAPRRREHYVLRGATPATEETSMPARADRLHDLVPPELHDALAGNSAARRQWARLPPSHRREYVEWVTGAKKEDTRRQRAARALEMIVDEKG
jgi:hypothetical protein